MYQWTFRFYLPLEMDFHFNTRKPNAKKTLCQNKNIIINLSVIKKSETDLFECKNINLIASQPDELKLRKCRHARLRTC